MRILISGILGRMGRLIAEIACKNGDIVEGIDKVTASLGEIPVFTDFDMISNSFDVVIDFSSPQNADCLLDFIIKTKIPAVVGTTGLTRKQLERINEVSQTVPIYYSQNMSAGVNLIIEMLKKINTSAWDKAITELHHKAKKDSPSGTALLLMQTLGDCETFSLRMGGNYGEHTIILANSDEEIYITHRALSRKAFALGAYQKAKELAEIYRT